MAAQQKQEALIQTFKDLLKQEQFGSQGDIVEALKKPKVMKTLASQKFLAC